MEIEWDPRKALTNKKKHGIQFEEAASVFGDPMAITFSDPDHSVGEYRFITFGMSLTQRMLVVSHTDRNGRIRIISARKMTLKEKRIYEEE